MNILKRVTALVTLIVFVFVTFTFNVGAAGVFSDVEPTHQYAEAIEKLYEDKIVDGYLAEDGTRTFMPENTITRAEFSKLLAVSLVPDQSVLAAMPTNFADVDNDEKISWAVPYIAYAVQSKIVNGYEDGSFRPFNEVTYAEAVKMIVCALGYGSQVEITEPWYEGYLKIARNIGALDNALSDANTPAKRGLVAQLIMNLKNVQSKNANIPIIIPGIGGENEGGGNNATIILPDDEEEIYEDDGQITAVFDTTLIGRTLNLTKKEIMISGRKYTLDDNLSYETYIPYLGYECDFEYIEDNNKDIIQKITIRNDYDIYEFKDESNIEDISSTTIEFYKKDSDSKTTKINIQNVSIIYNGYGIESVSNEEKIRLLTPENGTVKLLDNQGNKTADVAFVDSYETYFVGSVALDTYTVTDKNLKNNGVPKSIVLDEDYNVVFKTDKGVDTAFSSILKNTTTISVFGPYSGQDYSDIETYTNVIVSKKTAKGIVSSYDSAAGEYTINSKKYKVSPYYEQMIAQGGFSDQEISVGDSGTYYLDHLDRIVYVAVNDSSRYGYITSVDIPNRLDRNEYVIYMITNSADGPQAPSEFTLKDEVTINGVDYDFDLAIERLKASADIINGTKSVTNINAEYSQPIIFKTTLDGGTIIKSITTIDAEVEGESGMMEYEKGILADDTERTDYTSTNVFKNGSSTLFTMKFGTSSTNPTKVFVVPNNRNDDEDYAVYTKSSEVNKYFTVGNTYLVEGFNVSTSKIAEIVVVYGATPLVIDGKTPAYIVKSVIGKKNVAEGEDAWELTMYELGKKDPQPTILLTMNQNIGADIKAGDVIKFAQRGDSIAAIEKIFVGGQLYEPYNGDVEGEQDVADEYRTDEKSGTTAKYFTSLTGVVYLNDDSVLQIVPGFDTVLDEDSETYEADVEALGESESLGNYTTNTSTYVYVFDGEANSEQRIKFVNTGSLMSITQHGFSNASKVYMYRISGNAIKCIVIYKNVDFN